MKNFCDSNISDAELEIDNDSLPDIEPVSDVSDLFTLDDNVGSAYHNKHVIVPDNSNKITILDIRAAFTHTELKQLFNSRRWWEVKYEWYVKSTLDQNTNSSRLCAQMQMLSRET